ncbi:hypothetical protein AURDEDRAFT_187475 [Auricularia subglabra TFB-10046 SS5]|nr:hypothetical protein AURDEDRAFT_187475 [Auricularia subglabra TFB-10046 SS5]
MTMQMTSQDLATATPTLTGAPPNVVFSAARRLSISANTKVIVPLDTTPVAPQGPSALGSTSAMVPASLAPRKDTAVWIHRYSAPIQLAYARPLMQQVHAPPSSATQPRGMLAPFGPLALQASVTMLAPRAAPTRLRSGTASLPSSLPAAPATQLFPVGPPMLPQHATLPSKAPPRGTTPEDTTIAPPFTTHSVTPSAVFMPHVPPVVPPHVPPVVPPRRPRYHTVSFRRRHTRCMGGRRAPRRKRAPITMDPPSTTARPQSVQAVSDGTSLLAVTGAQAAAPAAAQTRAELPPATELPNRRKRARDAPATKRAATEEGWQPRSRLDSSESSVPVGHHVQSGNNIVPQRRPLALTEGGEAGPSSMPIGNADDWERFGDDEEPAPAAGRPPSPIRTQSNLYLPQGGSLHRVANERNAESTEPGPAPAPSVLALPTGGGGVRRTTVGRPGHVMRADAAPRP